MSILDKLSKAAIFVGIFTLMFSLHNQITELKEEVRIIKIECTK